MHAIAYILLIHAIACILTGCANPRDYDVVPEHVIYKTPDWSGGFEYKVRFEPKTTGEIPIDDVK